MIRLPAFGRADRRKAPWLVLWCGFGGLLVCIVAAATGTLLSAERVRQEETRIRKAFLGRLNELDQIRSQIYLSGTYVRDLLLSPDASGAAAQGSRIATLERSRWTASACPGIAQGISAVAVVGARTEVSAAR